MEMFRYAIRTARELCISCVSLARHEIAARGAHIALINPQHTKVRLQITWLKGQLARLLLLSLCGNRCLSCDGCTHEMPAPSAPLGAGLCAAAEVLCARAEGPLHACTLLDVSWLMSQHTAA